MSPERIQNKPYSFMSDIWSVGLVLQECATGKYPFHEQATCIDISINGAAFVVDGGSWAIETHAHPVLNLKNGTTVTGVLEIRSVVPREDGRVRVSGIMTWHDTGWLNEHIALAMVPGADRRRTNTSTPAFGAAAPQ